MAPEEYMLPCLFVKYLHVECPGCGTQRAMAALLRGEVLLSFQLYPALIPYLITVMLTAFQLVIKWKQGGFVVMGAFILSALVTVVHFVIKLLS
jgi:hypothetical protein